MKRVCVRVRALPEHACRGKICIEITSGAERVLNLNDDIFERYVLDAMAV